MNPIRKASLTAILTLLAIGVIKTAKAAPLAWSNNDVLVSFESTTSSLDYLVNLGLGSSLASSLTNNTFTPINLNADLNSVFGNEWYTNTVENVQWGLFGISSTKSIVYASVPSGNNSLPPKSPNALSTTATAYAALGQGYNTDLGNSQYPTNGTGIYQNVGSGLDIGKATWIGNTTTAPYFGVYNVTLVNNTTGKIDIYGTTTSISELLGTLQLSSAGVLSEVEAVPEPSIYGLLVLGILAFFYSYRRRRMLTADFSPR
jgi:hypothetical protein